MGLVAQKLDARGNCELAAAQSKEKDYILTTLFITITLS